MEVQVEQPMEMEPKPEAKVAMFPVVIIQQLMEERVGDTSKFTPIILL